MNEQREADKMVRYCPECGLIGPVKRPALACCPDSFGMHVRRWQAEKLERMLDRLRTAIAGGMQGTGRTLLDRFLSEAEKAGVTHLPIPADDVHACLKCGGKVSDCPYLPQHCPAGVGEVPRA